MHKTFVCDVEADNLLADVTKIHCLSYTNIDNEFDSDTLTDYEDIKNFLSVKDITVIGHNLIKYDIPVLEKILDIKLDKLNKIDTLGISWYLDPLRKKHGLEIYGKEFEVLKVAIADWENLTIEDYKHRCEEDVKINLILWQKQYKYLKDLYITDNNVYKFIKYLNFKLECVKEQEEIGIKLDVEKCARNLRIFEELKGKKIVELESSMPQIPIKITKVYKYSVTDDDGNLYIPGDLFFDEVSKTKKIEHNKSIDIIKGFEKPNANSPVQIKNWLYSLGWVPENIKFDRNKKTGEVKKIPQIAAPEGQGEICKSIKKLFDKAPALEVLDGLSVLSHRISILKGFLTEQKNGRVFASMNGFTNTLRLKHKVPIVNLPTVDKKYGKEIRECLIADDENSVLLATDISSLEDSTKRHLIYKYDPAYVEEMNTPGFDPHLDIALLAGMLTQKEVDEFKGGNKKNNHIRQKAKVVNFSATYKVSKDTLSKNSGLSVKACTELLKIYWERNKAILDVENDCLVKTINNQQWLQNPINKFWYSLRNTRDKFSTLNQGSGAFIFDMYLFYSRKEGLRIPFSYHDEYFLNSDNQDVEANKQKILNAMKEVNKLLKLNVTIGCSIQLGQSYDQCH